jgi:hypothetical protein
MFIPQTGDEPFVDPSRFQPDLTLLRYKNGIEFTYERGTLRPIQPYTITTDA